MRARRDPHRRRAIDHRVMPIERRPVHRLIAGAARSGGVATAVPGAGGVADEHLAGAELVPRAGND
jgi:hypothetical protein